jgi:hypothetical protein
MEQKKTDLCIQIRLIDGFMPFSERDELLTLVITFSESLSCSTSRS